MGIFNDIRLIIPELQQPFLARDVANKLPEYPKKQVCYCIHRLCDNGELAKEEADSTGNGRLMKFYVRDKEAHKPQVAVHNLPPIAKRWGGYATAEYPDNGLRKD